MADKPCDNCGGCGKIASHNGKPWSQFAGFGYHTAEMEVVRTGQTSPDTCPECGGLGKITSKK